MKCSNLLFFNGVYIHLKAFLLCRQNDGRKLWSLNMSAYKNFSVVCNMKLRFCWNSVSFHFIGHLFIYDKVLIHFKTKSLLLNWSFIVFSCKIVITYKNFLPRMYEVKPFTCGGISTHIRIYDMVSDWLCNMAFDTEM
jgi:hypothetical protein